MTYERVQLRQITKLTWPFPEKVIQTNPSGGGSYVAHPLVEQRLIDVLGHPPTTQLVQLVHGVVAAKPPNPNANSTRGKAGSPQLDNAVVGVVLRMSCVIDGHEVVVEEIGDCEDPHNWSTDGQRAKDAFSDAYKRCAMRLGVALHLWVKDPQKHYYIAQKLMKQDGEVEVAAEVPHTVPFEATVVDPQGDAAGASEPGDPEPESAESDENPPSSSPEAPAQPPIPEPAQPDSGIDWKAEGKELKLTQIEVLQAARELAEERKVPRDKLPGSLRHIPEELNAPLFERLTTLADAKEKRKQAAKDALAEAEA